MASARVHDGDRSRLLNLELCGPWHLYPSILMGLHFFTPRDKLTLARGKVAIEVPSASNTEEASVWDSHAQHRQYGIADRATRPGGAGVAELLHAHAGRQHLLDNSDHEDGFRYWSNTPGYGQIPGMHGEAERRFRQIEDMVWGNTTVIYTLQIKIKALKSKVNTAENNYLWIVGLPEEAEGKDSASFVERLLKSLLPQALFSAFFAVERAHCMPSTRGPLGSPPHTFYLQVAGIWSSESPENQRKSLMNMLDLSSFQIKTQKLHRTFDHVKYQLRNRGIKYSMLFPARL